MGHHTMITPFKGHVESNTVIVFEVCGFFRVCDAINHRYYYYYNCVQSRTLTLIITTWQHNRGYSTARNASFVAIC